ncbi:MAG: class I SAM-dependent methyltransferase [Raoultibacter sp.]|jgi:O-methyltransferase involved in polyketide biosynthesis
MNTKQEKRSDSLQGVADTLYIPLEARIYASKRFPEYFYDEKALALEAYLPASDIKSQSSEYSMLASAARYYQMDKMVNAFIVKHSRCNIVYLGAGLETAYFRLEGARRKAIFYEVDLPEVMAARCSILGENENEVLIGANLFDLSWTDGINTAAPSLLVASGVFQYFKEEDVTRFVTAVRSIFTNGELIFDATNESGIRYANSYVQKTGNINAQMHFYVNDGLEFAQSVAAEMLEERVFFLRQECF